MLCRCIGYVFGHFSTLNRWEKRTCNQGLGQNALSEAIPVFDSRLHDYTLAICIEKDCWKVANFWSCLVLQFRMPGETVKDGIINSFARKKKMWTHGSSEPEIVDFEFRPRKLWCSFRATLQSDQKVADEIDVNICQWDKGHAGHAFLDAKGHLAFDQIWKGKSEVRSPKQIILWFTMLCFRLRLIWLKKALSFFSWADFDSNQSNSALQNQD